MLSYVAQEGSYRRLARLHKSREVMHMSDFELLTIVFTVIGLLISVAALSKKR